MRSTIGMKALLSAVAVCTLMFAGSGTATASTTPGVQATPYNEGGEWWAAESDYCSVVPETGWWNGAYFDFAHACLHHDGCYGEHWADKSTCDWWFYNDMRSSCAAIHGWVSPSFKPCHDLATIYYAGVTAFGQNAYDQHSMTTPMNAYV